MKRERNRREDAGPARERTRPVVQPSGPTPSDVESVSVNDRGTTIYATARTGLRDRVERALGSNPHTLEPANCLRPARTATPTRRELPGSSEPALGFPPGVGGAPTGGSHLELLLPVPLPRWHPSERRFGPSPTQAALPVNTLN